MQVRCPHCSNVFAATSSGIQPCPVCATPIDVPASGDAAPPVGFGPQGDGAQAPLRENTPWEDRERLGWVQGLVQTWKRSVLKPQEFWPTVRPEGALGSALGYGWLMSALGILLALPLILLQLPQMMSEMASMQELMGTSPDALGIFQSVGPLAIGVAAVIGVLVLWPVGALIYVSLVHASALLVGAGDKGFNATARAYFYAQGPNLLSAIPFAGTLVSVYSMVLFGWGMKELHGTSPGKAAMAVLLPILVVCCCGCAALIAGAGAIGAAMNGMSQ